MPNSTVIKPKKSSFVHVIDRGQSGLPDAFYRIKNINPSQSYHILNADHIFTADLSWKYTLIVSAVSALPSAENYHT